MFYRRTHQYFPCPSCDNTCRVHVIIEAHRREDLVGVPNHKYISPSSLEMYCAVCQLLISPIQHHRGRPRPQDLVTIWEEGPGTYLQDIVIPCRKELERINPELPLTDLWGTDVLMPLLNRNYDKVRPELKRMFDYIRVEFRTLVKTWWERYMEDINTLLTPEVSNVLPKGNPHT